ncbi:MAG: STAS domain-containing protein [Spirochaetaceae bacterium]|nr:MAG: STAS domain-containing protein [Spirochaetaceae bacterium]
MTENGSLKVITLDRRATIDRAEALRVMLLDALAHAPSTLVNLSHVEAIDLTAIHLLYAAKRQALSEKKRFDFTGTVPSVVRDALEQGGFCKRAPEEGPDLAAALLDFERPAGATNTGADRSSKAKGVRHG